jgi:hypothetical protein
LLVKIKNALSFTLSCLLSVALSSLPYTILEGSSLKLNMVKASKNIKQPANNNCRTHKIDVVIKKIIVGTSNKIEEVQLAVE